MFRMRCILLRFEIGGQIRLGKRTSSTNKKARTPERPSLKNCFYPIGGLEFECGAQAERTSFSPRNGTWTAVWLYYRGDNVAVAQGILEIEL